MVVCCAQMAQGLRIEVEIEAFLYRHHLKANLYV
jgi:hypothetical protein